jgi:hypothetical protein
VSLVGNVSKANFAEALFAEPISFQGFHRTGQLSEDFSGATLCSCETGRARCSIPKRLEHADLDALKKEVLLAIRGLLSVGG